MDLQEKKRDRWEGGDLQGKTSGERIYLEEKRSIMRRPFRQW